MVSEVLHRNQQPAPTNQPIQPFQPVQLKALIFPNHLYRIPRQNFHTAPRALWHRNSVATVALRCCCVVAILPTHCSAVATATASGLPNVHDELYPRSPKKQRVKTVKLKEPKKKCRGFCFWWKKDAGFYLVKNSSKKEIKADDSSGILNSRWILGRWAYWQKCCWDREAKKWWVFLF